MKVIFLEIDGVIIHESSKIVARLLQTELTAFNPSVEALNMLAAETKATVIVTSARRAMGLGLLTDFYKKWGIQAPVDVTPIAPTKNDGIKKWLDQSGEWGFSKVESFVIIDYEGVYEESFSDRIVLTDKDRGGLNMEQAQRAIEILRR